MDEESYTILPQRELFGFEICHKRLLKIVAGRGFLLSSSKGMTHIYICAAGICLIHEYSHKHVPVKPVEGSSCSSGSSSFSSSQRT